MKILIIAAGKPALSFAKSGIEEYAKRLTRYGQVELKIVKDGNSETVSQRLLEASEGCVRVALDERGKFWTTAQMTDFVTTAQLTSVKKIAFLIGASDGHTEELRHSCDHILALSGLTLQHEFALLLLYEQIYRVYTIINGTPYHR